MTATSLVLHCSGRRSLVHHLDTSTVSLQRRSFTFPDLSKLSPFSSSSPTSSVSSSTGGTNGKKTENGHVYHETVVMPYSKELLFDIVSKVNEYEAFVPYCVHSKVDENSVRRNNKDKTTHFLAELAIGYGQFREAYTSKVTIVDDTSVRAIAVPTPLFDSLETTWIFTSQSKESTKVDFSVSYAFSNPFYAAFAQAAIEKMTGKMIDAFQQRAETYQTSST